MSHLLHPPLLDEAGLASALRSYVEGLEERSGLIVELKVDPKLQRMPQELEAALFRVVQESLTNIHRHANTKTAKVLVRYNPPAVKIQIQDKGRGIPGFESLECPTSGPVTPHPMSLPQSHLPVQPKAKRHAHQRIAICAASKAAAARANNRSHRI